MKLKICKIIFIILLIAAIIVLGLIIFKYGRNQINEKETQEIVDAFRNIDFPDTVAENEINQNGIVEGEITKGDYHGEMPILKIDKIQRIEKPQDEFVYPPDDSFVPTSTIL